LNEDEIMIMIDAKTILDVVLEWEKEIFLEHIFTEFKQQMPNKNEKEIEKKVNQYLVFIDDFKLIWKKLYSKYLGIRNESIK
jgi:hypothetical protein